MSRLTQILNRPDDADGFNVWDVSGDTPVRYADGFNAGDASGDTPLRYWPFQSGKGGLPEVQTCILSV